MQKSNESEDGKEGEIARNPAGRPKEWASLITAPEKALRFYELMAELVDSVDFEICHVFSGAKNGNTPVIKHKGKVRSIASVIGPFLTLDIGRKQCSTFGCCNPFHYMKADRSDFVVKNNTPEPLLQIPLPSGEEFAEVVQYEIDRQALRYKKPYQFDDLRPHIDQIDLSDVQLMVALEWMNTN